MVDTVLSSVLTSLTGSSPALYDDDNDVPALPTSWRALQVVAVVVLAYGLFRFSALCLDACCGRVWSKTVSK